MAYNTVRYPMPASRRAKQFQPFDALRGFKEAIAATERFTEPKRDLAEFRIEEINEKLVLLQKGQIVIVTYYGENEKHYLQLTGSVVTVDPYWKTLQVNDVVIEFSEIYSIKIIES